jgi:hypothetical protein
VVLAVVVRYLVRQVQVRLWVVAVPQRVVDQ